MTVAIAFTEKDRNITERATLLCINYKVITSPTNPCMFVRV